MAAARDVIDALVRDPDGLGSDWVLNSSVSETEDGAVEAMVREHGPYTDVFRVEVRLVSSGVAREQLAREGLSTARQVMFGDEAQPTKTPQVRSLRQPHEVRITGRIRDGAQIFDVDIETSAGVTLVFTPVSYGDGSMSAPIRVPVPQADPYELARALRLGDGRIPPNRGPVV